VTQSTSYTRADVIDALIGAGYNVRHVDDCHIAVNNRSVYLCTVDSLCYCYDDMEHILHYITQVLCEGFVL